MVACSCLLLMEYARIQNIHMGLEPGFTSSLKILIVGIIISVFSIATIVLIIKFKYQKSILNFVLSFLTIVFLLIYGVIAYIFRDLIALNF